MECKCILLRKRPSCRFMHSLCKNENIPMWGKHRCCITKEIAIYPPYVDHYLTYMYNIATIANVTPLIIPIPCYEEIFNFVIETFFIKGQNPVVLLFK